MSPGWAAATTDATASANELAYEAGRFPFSLIWRARASPVTPSIGASLAA
jgi:hypothetical protein